MSVTVKSQNDVLWFCLVLLVEVFGLSVALGGPWIEVSYFLLVVISQTIAGAYIWAHLRKHELRLPIPELLAMGFTIGSSTAAISQLFLRDLLGVRLMISPYVPIIAVAIWLIFKRSPRLAVEITHTDSTTLLWLLFPAPLALTQYSYPTFIFFVLPLFLLALFFNSKKFYLNLVSIFVLPFILLISFVLGSFINFVSNNGSGISRAINNDLRYDVAYAIGTARWGANSNIAFFGQTESYYKASYLWLGPIFSPLNSKAIDLIEASVPAFLISILGFAIWTLTQKIEPNTTIAGLSSVLIYLQPIMPDSLQLSIRPNWLLGLIYLVTAASLLLVGPWRDASIVRVIVSVSGFFVAITRLSLVFPIFAMTFFANMQINNLIIYCKRVALNWLFLSASVFAGFVLFSYPQGSLSPRALLIDLKEWPLDPFTSTRIALMTTLCISTPFYIYFFLETKFKVQRQKPVLLLCVFLISNAFIPRQYSADQDFLTPFLVLTAPFISIALWHARSQTIDFSSTRKKLITFSLLSGIGIRLLYDFYILNDKWQNRVELFLNKFVNSGDTFAITPLVVSIIAVFVISRKLLLTKSARSFSLFVLTIFSTNVGIFVATTVNPISDALFNDAEIFDTTTHPIVERWQNNMTIMALGELRDNSSDEDVVASNFGQGKDAPYDDDFRVQLSLQKQMYLTGPQYQLLDRYDSNQRTKNPNLISKQGLQYLERLRTRFLTSVEFPVRPSDKFLQNMLEQNVKWFVVDLERTELRDWEPWATTRFINDKVAILELATEVKS